MYKNVWDCYVQLSIKYITVSFSRLSCNVLYTVGGLHIKCCFTLANLYNMRYSDYIQLHYDL